MSYLSINLDQNPECKSLVKPRASYTVLFAAPPVQTFFSSLPKLWVALYIHNAFMIIDSISMPSSEVEDLLWSHEDSLHSIPWEAQRTSRQVLSHHSNGIQRFSYFGYILRRLFLLQTSLARSSNLVLSNLLIMWPEPPSSRVNPYYFTYLTF